MMKGKVLIVLFFAITAGLNIPARGQVDSLQRAKLLSMLDKYYETMIFEPNEVKKRECDFLIESCTDSLVRQEVATSILEHYMDPPLMGEEAVAVYLYEKWFLDGSVRIADEMISLQADVFYQFNRRSLIDMPAPAVELENTDGGSVIFPQKGPAVLFFYDIHCSKCLLMTYSLARVLSETKFPLTLYAVYVGDDVEQWPEYYKSKFAVDNPFVKVEHLRVPDASYDVLSAYGVSSTPKVLFIDGEKIIRGRRLEEDSLGQIINIYESYY